MLPSTPGMSLVMGITTIETPVTVERVRSTVARQVDEPDAAVHVCLSSAQFRNYLQPQSPRLCRQCGIPAFVERVTIVAVSVGILI